MWFGPVAASITADASPMLHLISKELNIKGNTIVMIVSGKKRIRGLKTNTVESIHLSNHYRCNEIAEGGHNPSLKCVNSSPCRKFLCITGVHSNILSLRNDGLLIPQWLKYCIPVNARVLKSSFAIQLLIDSGFFEFHWNTGVSVPKYLVLFAQLGPVLLPWGPSSISHSIKSSDSALRWMMIVIIILGRVKGPLYHTILAADDHPTN